MKNKKKGMSITGKQRVAGWIYLAPATILIFIMSFWPIIQAVITSFKTGSSANMQWANPLTYNYTRMFQDAVFKRSIGNTFLYLIIEVPIMLVLAILLAQLLNNKHLKFKGLFRTCVFLPCATSLVSYALIFKSLFATQGLINTILVKLGILENNFNFLGTGWSAKIIIIVALIWRWTGYNMVFFLSGLQNIEYSVYEAAKIDGAGFWRTTFSVTLPMLKGTTNVLIILGIVGSLKTFDIVKLLTGGGPGRSTTVMNTYLYEKAFKDFNAGGAASIGVAILIIAMVMSFLQVKFGKED